MPALTDIVDPAREILNASTTFGTSDDPKRYSDNLLNALALDADADICNLIASTPNHPRRTAFAATLGPYSDGATIASNLGILDVSIDSVPARHKAATEIKRMVTLTTPLGLSQIDKYYDIKGGRITHNGTTASLLVAQFAKTASPQMPDEYVNAGIALLLAMAFPKDGVNVAAAQHYSEQAKIRMDMVAAGASSIPPVIQYQHASEKIG